MVNKYPKTYGPTAARKVIRKMTEKDNAKITDEVCDILLFTFYRKTSEVILNKNCDMPCDKQPYFSCLTKG